MQHIFKSIHYMSACAILMLMSTVFSDTVTVGIVTDGLVPRSTMLRKTFVAEVTELVRNEHVLRFTGKDIVDGTCNPAAIRQQYTELLHNPEVDLVCALGPISSAIAVGQQRYPKPVIAPFIIDHIIQHAPYVKGASGVENLCYLNLPLSIKEDLAFFRQVSRFERCAVLVDRSYAGMVPEMPGHINDIATQLGCTIDYMTVGGSADSVLHYLSDSVDAVYVTRLPLFSMSETARLLSGFKKRKLPSFSPMGEDEVRKGIMLTRMPDLLPRIIRRTALSVQKILMGEKPSEFTVDLQVNEKVSFNRETAAAIGFDPPWYIFNEANMYGRQHPEKQRVLILSDAVTRALEKNSSYRAYRHKTAATGHKVLAARSYLMPKLALGVQGSAIEKELAAVSMGAPPQYSLSASATATQLLYSDQVMAGIAISRHAYSAGRFGFMQKKLDLTAEVTSAYYDVLEAASLERIMRKTMEQSRNYLQLAHIRTAVGTSDKSEEYRWESRIAMNLKDLIEANAVRNSAEIQLNRLLELPHEQEVLLENDGSDPSSLTKEWEHYTVCFRSKTSFKAFRDFMVTEAIKNSPEIKALDEGIAIYERQFKAAKRAVWMPTLAAQAKAETMFHTRGTGSDYTPALPPGIAQPDDLNLSVGVSLSLPVYSGVELIAKVKEQSEAVQQKKQEREAVVCMIEQRIRSSLHRCGAAYAGLEQAQKAAHAAGNARKMVEDAYAQGAVSFTDLSDAQTQEQIAHAASSQAVFSYLKMLMLVQRASGQFDFFRSGKELTEYKKRLQLKSVATNSSSEK